jgi:hypothetical protein
MGTFHEGILGGFKGKIGTVVGGKWRGITYMRAKGEPNRSKFSDKQVVQQARFGLATRFIQPLQAVYNIGYRSQIKRKTAINSALSDIITEAVTGDYPQFEINYPLLRISKGSLVATNSANVVLQGDGIGFTWSVGDTLPETIKKNQVLLVAIGDKCYPSMSLLEYTRGAGSGTLALPYGEPGTVVHCYVGFVSTVSKDVSNSFYAGSITLP